MSQLEDEDSETHVDGRVARRQRNIESVIDVVLEMFAEDAMFPTVEQAATRSGLSLRSLYRYFADQGALVEAAFERTAAIGSELSQLDAIGQGPLDQRIDEFVAMRLRVHAALGPVLRATMANAARHERVAERRARNRIRLREQFELQFAPELASLPKTERAHVLAAGDLLTQIESIDFLMRPDELTDAEAHAALTHGLRALLA